MQDPCQLAIRMSVYGWKQQSLEMSVELDDTGQDVMARHQTWPHPTLLVAPMLNCSL